MKEKIIILLLITISLFTITACNKADESFESGNNQEMGDYYFQDGKYNEAIKKYKEAISEAEDGELYFKVGKAYKKLGNKNMAKESFQKALKLSPSLGEDVKKELDELSRE